MPLLLVGGDLASWVLVEIGTGWISFAGDRCCLYLMRWRLVLFGLGERKRMEGERKREPCVWVLGKSDGKKKKGCIRRYGAQAVCQVWVPQKVEIFE